MSGNAKPNALLGLASYYSGSALVFSLDTEIGRLVSTHGAQAVREAVKRRTAMRKGRKPEKDWVALREWIEQDARDWLDGNDPFAIRTNYFLAKQVALAAPKHYQVATHRRVMGKLAKRRKIMILLSAWQLAEKERPFADYFRAVEAIALADAKWGESLQAAADIRRGQLERYRERFGELPASITVNEAEEALKAPLPAPPRRNALGLFGSRYP